ncbi:MAG: acetate kinase [Reichenbachiella sp.]
MKILVLNSGSSSLKYQLFDMPEGRVICSGQVDKIGEVGGSLKHNINDKTINITEDFKDHQIALEKLADTLIDSDHGAIDSPDEIDAVGHRVVHGGEAFKATTLIDDSVKQKIKELFSLAPLHNPPNYQGIAVAEKVFTSAKQIAVFDTAFHSTLPAKAFRFAIPNKLYEEFGIRTYGFHGTSHRFVSREAITHLGLTGKNSKVITIHLGNGSSMAAIQNGQSVDISMGLGPLGGLVMGTRSGDIDPSILFFLQENGYTVNDVKNILNKESGMKGLTGENDMRLINSMADSGNLIAELALELYAYRIKKYIGSYAAALNGLDAIIFTAGVGENDAKTRKRICDEMDFMGLSIDDGKNNSYTDGIAEIQNGKTKILIIPTNEELEIANQCVGVLK